MKLMYEFVSLLAICVAAIVSGIYGQSVSNANCTNTLDLPCNYFTPLYPSFCQTPGIYISTIPFNIFCAKACNNCNASYTTSLPTNITPVTLIVQTTSTTVQSTTTTTTVTPSITGTTKNCTNKVDYPCTYFINLYPSFCQAPGVYISAIPFNIFCAKTCNNC